VNETESLNIVPKNRVQTQSVNTEHLEKLHVESPWRKKLNSKRFYDETALSYRALYGEEQSLKYNAVLATLEGQLSGSVLDIGCGPGIFLRRISNPALLLVGVDTSVRMLRVAAATRSNPSNLICADADFLPFRDKTFETVFAFTLLQNLPNPMKSLQELGRVAGEEGSVVVTIHKGTLSQEGVYTLLRHEYPLLREIKTGDDVRDYAFICRRHRPTEAEKTGRNEFNPVP
jgi:ubiquinone/menaquinone biosynthesis C-methylase UbiE